jgi:hypothetical protein
VAARGSRRRPDGPRAQSDVPTNTFSGQNLYRSGIAAFGPFGSVMRLCGTSTSSFVPSASSTSVVPGPGLERTLIVRVGSEAPPSKTFSPGLLLPTVTFHSLQARIWALKNSSASRSGPLGGIALAAGAAEALDGGGAGVEGAVAVSAAAEGAVGGDAGVGLGSHAATAATAASAARTEAARPLGRSAKTRWELGKSSCIGVVRAYAKVPPSSRLGGAGWTSGGTTRVGVPSDDAIPRAACPLRVRSSLATDTRGALVPGRGDGQKYGAGWIALFALGCSSSATGGSDAAPPPSDAAPPPSDGAVPTASGCVAPLVRLRTGPDTACSGGNEHMWPTGLAAADCHGWRSVDTTGRQHDNSASQITCNPDGSFSFTQYAGNLTCAGSGVTKTYRLNVCEQDTPPTLYTTAVDLTCCASPSSAACVRATPSVSVAGATIYLNGAPCP